MSTDISPPTAEARVPRRVSSRTTARTAAVAVSGINGPVDLPTTRRASLNDRECWNRSRLPVSRAIDAGSRTFGAEYVRDISVCCKNKEMKLHSFKT